MAITANVAYFKSEFVASLSDGRHIERHDWREMAQALYELGVDDSAVQYEWHNGQRMITAGQQVALRSEIRRLAHDSTTPTVKNRAAAA
ncbi:MULTISPECIES: hypothetical protein [Azonexaceae]|uniref:hypothetical protein n=1 Tax=Azonexaceae TaxID=2008795 RepID=UPI001CF873D7|nr:MULTISPECIES: hypothetical protein [Azonexaceae]UCV23408.1 hypothetical protein KI613_02355 [Ferribacterium limneticum]